MQLAVEIAIYDSSINILTWRCYAVCACHHHQWGWDRIRSWCRKSAVIIAVKSGGSGKVSAMFSIVEDGSTSQRHYC